MLGKFLVTKYMLLDIQCNEYGTFDIDHELYLLDYNCMREIHNLKGCLKNKTVLIKTVFKNKFNKIKNVSKYN